MRRYLMQMKPKELANVIAMVALFRPGPMDFIPGYIRRMHGEEAVNTATRRWSRSSKRPTDTRCTRNSSCSRS